jgi:CelD/BcsL family acetyltransferase involved in cellulose biosynthesis
MLAHSRIANLGSMRDSCEIVTDIGGLRSLQRDWNGLCERASQPHFSQSFLWCLTTWDVVECPRGRRLHCIVVREDQRVVLIWPFILHRKSLFWKAAPLGSAYAEYASPLVEDGPDAERWMRLALKKLRATSGCDVIVLPHVRQASLFGRLMSEENAKITSRVTNLCIDWRGYEDWETFYRGLQRKDRRDTQRRRRRLDEQGQVSFNVIEGVSCVPLIDWALRNKIEQLARTDRRASWLNDGIYRELLVQAAVRSDPSGTVVVFALDLEDRIIATLICRVDKTRIEALNTVYDPAYSKYAPGKILMEESLKWAFHHGLQMDFRGGDFAYKRLWANSESFMISYEIANSRRYALYRRWREISGKLAACLKGATSKRFGGPHMPMR